MNKKMKRIVILLGVLVVACIAAFAASQYQVQQEKIASTEDVILAIETGDATAISWEFEDEDADTDSGEASEGTFSFTLEDGVWIYADDESFPTDTEVIESLLEIFTEFGASFIIEEVEDYSQYGLSDPCAAITITTADAEYVIELGDFSTMDSQRYVSIGDGNAYLVSVDPMDYYALALSDLIDNDELPSFDAVSQIEIDADETYSIYYEEESAYAYSEDDIYYTDTDDGTTALDADAVTSYLSTISSLDLTDYLTYSVTDDELTEYGFDDPELTVTVDYTDVLTDDDGNETEESGTFVITVARDADQIAAAAAAEEEDADSDTDTDTTDEDEEEIAAYVRIGESSMIYGITSDEYTSLMEADYEDLCHLELVPFAESEITSAEVTLDGETYVFTAEYDEDEETVTWYYEDEEIGSTDFADSLLALSLTDLDEDAAGEEEEISVTVYVSNENYSSVSLTLYRYDGTYCAAETDGTAAGLVLRSDVVDLIEAVNSIILD